MGVFELTEEMVEQKIIKKAVHKLCGGLKLAYRGGTLNLTNNLQESILLLIRKPYLPKIIRSKEASHDWFIPVEGLSSGKSKYRHDAHY